jgi:hypothetical protein
MDSIRKPGPPVAGLGGLNAGKRLAEQSWQAGYDTAKREALQEQGVRIVAALVATAVIVIGRRRGWWG